MTALLKLPSWLLSLVYILAFTPLFIARSPMILGFLGMLVNEDNHGIESSTLGLLVALTLSCCILLYSWSTAILYYYCTRIAKNTLPLLPAFFSLFCLLLLAFVLLSDVTEHALLLLVSDNILEPVLGNDYFMSVTMFCIVLTSLYSMLATIKIFGIRRRDWVIIPLQFLLLPFGIWWLQPKLKQLVASSQTPKLQDHLL